MRIDSGDEDLKVKFGKAIIHITENMRDLERSYLILQFTRIFHKYFEEDENDHKRTEITQKIIEFLLESSINTSNSDLIMGLFSLLPIKIQEEIGILAAIKNMKIYEYIVAGKFE